MRRSCGAEQPLRGLVVLRRVAVVVGDRVEVLVDAVAGAFGQPLAARACNAARSRSRTVS